MRVVSRNETTSRVSRRHLVLKSGICHLLEWQIPLFNTRWRSLCGWDSNKRLRDNPICLRWAAPLNNTSPGLSIQSSSAINLISWPLLLYTTTTDRDGSPNTGQTTDYRASPNKKSCHRTHVEMLWDSLSAMALFVLCIVQSLCGYFHGNYKIIGTMVSENSGNPDSVVAQGPRFAGGVGVVFQLPSMGRGGRGILMGQPEEREKYVYFTKITWLGDSRKD